MPPQLTTQEKVNSIVNATQGSLYGKTFGNDETGLVQRFARDVLRNEDLLMPRGTDQLSLSQRYSMANRIATVWKNDADHSVISDFAGQLRGNPAMLARFKTFTPEESLRVFEGYARNPAGLNKTVSDEYASHPRPLPQAPQAAAGTGAQSNNTRNQQQAATETHTRSTPRTPTFGIRNGADTNASSAPAPAAGRPAASTPAPGTPSPVAATAGAAGPIDQGIAVATIDQVLTQSHQIFGEEFTAQEQAVRDRMNRDPAFRQSLTDAINRDPALLRQIEAAGDGGNGGLGALVERYNQQSPEVQTGIKDGIRSAYREFLTNPEKIADPAFRQGMENAATQAGTSAGINGFFQKIFGGNFDLSGSLSGIGNGFMSFLSPIFKMIGDLFSGMNSGGNFMSMGNGSGGLLDMFSGAMSGMSEAARFGNTYSQAQRYQLAEARAVDRNHDGKISDGYQYDDKGKRVQETVTGPDGKEIKRDKYDASKDDRIEVTDAAGGKHKVFETTGTEAGSWEGRPVQFYVTRVDPKSGAPMAGETIFAQNGQVTRTHTDTGEPVRTSTAPTPGQNASPTTVAQNGPVPAGANGPAAPDAFNGIY